MNNFFGFFLLIPVINLDGNQYSEYNQEQFPDHKKGKCFVISFTA